MTGKENVRRAIEFDSPGHVPVHIDVNFNWLEDKEPYKQDKLKELISSVPDDMLVRGYHPPIDIQIDEKTGIRSWLDEWGVGWLDDGHGARAVTQPYRNGKNLTD